MKRKKQKTQGSFSFKKLEKIYKKYLKWSLKYPKWIALSLGLFLFLSFFQGWNLFKKFTLFPARGLQGVNIRMELSPNSSLSETERHAKKLSVLLNKDHEEVFDGFFSNIGQAQMVGDNFGFRKTLPNIAMITIFFTSDPSFVKKEKQVLSEIQKRIKKFSEETGVFTSLTFFRPGPPIGKPIQIQVISRSKKDRLKAGKAFKIGIFQNKRSAQS